MTFDAFRSLCTTPMECRYFMPSTTCLAMHSCAAEDLTCLVAATMLGWRRISRSDPPMQNSVMMYVFQCVNGPRCDVSMLALRSDLVSGSSFDGPV